MIRDFYSKPFSVKFLIQILVFSAALFTVICLLSCSKVSDKPIPSYKTISAAELTKIILNNNPTNTLIPRIVTSDSEYILPDESWINGELTVQFRKFLFDYNVRQYSPDNNDCDKFSLYCRTVANILNRHNTLSKVGIALGEFRYINGITGHSINFIITSDKFSEIKVIYYEPQTFQIIQIDKDTTAPLAYTL